VVNNQSWPVARQSHEITIITKNGVTVDNMDIHINLPAPKTPTFPANSNNNFIGHGLNQKITKPSHMKQETIL
jgi:hypothetical protein